MTMRFIALECECDGVSANARGGASMSMPYLRIPHRPYYPNPNNHESPPHAMTLSYIEYMTTAFGTTRIK
jgi:hypothetical protein